MCCTDPRSLLLKFLLKRGHPSFECLDLLLLLRQGFPQLLPFCL
jgi:hypothetical protein